MPALRPKKEDKFSQARAAKNAPARKDTPPKSVQVELDRIAALKNKKRTEPRGPSSAKPRQSPPGYGYKSKATGERSGGFTRDEVIMHTSAPKIRDEERVYNLVHAILSAWKADIGHAEHTAASAGIIKVSRRKIEGALRDLKNTRFTKIPSLINDVLVYNEVCKEFGQWVYVEHDSPDWIFVRLPENSTPVIRADINVDRRGETSPAITTSSEALLDAFEGQEEDEIPENVECVDKEDEFSSWTLTQLQDHAWNMGYIGIKDAGWKDRAVLIERINNKGAIE